MAMADNYPHPQFVMEFTVLSAEKLKKPSSRDLFSFSRPSTTFISITKLNGDNYSLADYCKPDSENFTFGDKVFVSIESDFFANNSCIYLKLYTKKLLGDQAQLGWCRIPAADIGAPPVGSVRHLSYKLRDKDGSMGHGIVDLQVKLESYGCPVHSGQEVIGTPVTDLQASD
ncbi:hypothetical protein DITRI_Ditri04bG0122200 [Diplodiscus trichospermus]